MDVSYHNSLGKEESFYYFKADKSFKFYSNCSEFLLLQ